MKSISDLRRRMAQVIDEYLELDKALRVADQKHFRICIFGSARILPGDAIYDSVYDVASRLARLGIDIVTGGGPGLMEAANRAVQDVHNRRVRSYGLPLDIPGLTEVANAHLDIKSMHHRFSSRLDEFMRLSNGVIVAPGGIGTLLELFYVWQLLQLHMVDPRPVVLLDRAFWSGLIHWMNETVLAGHLISPVDLDHVHLVDTPEEAVATIKPALKTWVAEREKNRRGGLPPRPQLQTFKAPDPAALAVAVGSSPPESAPAADEPGSGQPTDVLSPLQSGLPTAGDTASTGLSAVPAPRTRESRDSESSMPSWDRARAADLGAATRRRRRGGPSRPPGRKPAS